MFFIVTVDVNNRAHCCLLWSDFIEYLIKTLNSDPNAQIMIALQFKR